MSAETQKNFRSTPLSFFATRTGIIFTGALIGLIACLLTLLGNPVNMGVCVACFIRDIAGALGLHRAGVVQYLRPEIPAFVLGSCLAALTFGEFRARGGSSPVIRFVLGAFAPLVCAAARSAGMPEDRIRAFDTLPELAAALVAVAAPGDVLLLKGSRRMQLEKLIELLPDAGLQP